jgi:hypothetical protein
VHGFMKLGDHGNKLCGHWNIKVHRPMFLHSLV